MISSPRLRTSLALALLALLGLPALATAHAELISSAPPGGGTITMPYTLRAEFDEQLTGNSRVVVRDLTEREVASGAISADDAAVMTVALADLQPGEYIARWRAITDDGGLTRGEFAFTVVEPASAGPSPTPSEPPTATPSGATGSPAPTASPALAPTAGPSPTGGEGQPTAGTTDLLIALVVGAALVALLVIFLWRRRAA